MEDSYFVTTGVDVLSLLPPKRELANNPSQEDQTGLYRAQKDAPSLFPSYSDHSVSVCGLSAIY